MPDDCPRRSHAGPGLGISAPSSRNSTAALLRVPYNYPPRHAAHDRADWPRAPKNVYPPLNPQQMARAPSRDQAPPSGPRMSPSKEQPPLRAHASTCVNPASAAVPRRRTQKVCTLPRSADAAPLSVPKPTPANCSIRAPQPIGDGTSTGSARPSPAPTPPLRPTARADAPLVESATEHVRRRRSGRGRTASGMHSCPQSVRSGHRVQSASRSFGARSGWSTQPSKR